MENSIFVREMQEEKNFVFLTFYYSYIEDKSLFNDSVCTPISVQKIALRLTRHKTTRKTR